MLACEFHLASGPEFLQEPALSAQAGGSNFGARCMPNIITPINLEAKMIVDVNHFCDFSISFSYVFLYNEGRTHREP